MYFSKSLNCCLEARTFVGCSPITSEPCLGFTGDCIDLPSAFAGIEVPGAPGIPEDYVCLQFPNEESARDSFILGLLSWACSLPVNIMIVNMFWNANTSDYDPNWLRWDFNRRLFLGGSNWRYRDPEKPRSALQQRVATAWSLPPLVWYNFLQWLVERPTAWAYSRAVRRRAKRGEPVPEPGSRLEAGLMTQTKMELFGVIGMCSVYLVWAIMSWIIFTYGSLVYKLMGDAAQQKFASSWGIGLAISQATQFKARCAALRCFGGTRALAC
jgi:hypothetical protein